MTAVKFPRGKFPERLRSGKAPTYKRQQPFPGGADKKTKEAFPRKNIP
jgi:hypothetical protein